ncbi:PR-1-like protein [Pluteus cervinus]|uniref:PR-1-like protein n=1 Tax=Pluteus cervinus TaxID=181527 RepID=A0ACD3ASG7_9AGAR|nr:PR-1-like protein [Pluteus cervinus]
MIFRIFCLFAVFIPALVVATNFTSPNLESVRGSQAQIDGFLSTHNEVRAAHGADPLAWSVPLADLAAAWADSCLFEPSGGTLRTAPYGENVVAATGFFPITAAVNAFTQDAGQYNPASPTFSHFTQVVWKSTTQLGCAISRCNGIFDPSLRRASLYVCLYDPPGNVLGEASQNIQV